MSDTPENTTPPEEQQPTTEPVSEPVQEENLQPVNTDSGTPISNAGPVLRDEVPEGKKFQTGAKPSPPYVLAGARPFVPIRTLLGPPVQKAYVPKKLLAWGNDQYGVCVTSEECFAKDCHNPNILISNELAISWARSNGWLNGAYLTEVMDAMQNDGFKVGSQTYNDGPYRSVDWSNESLLQAALAQGVVKIAMHHSSLPSGAGNKQGWYAVGADRQYRGSDHCIAIAGYGPAGWLYEQLDVALPSALTANQVGYLIFTWGTIGFVDHKWLMSTCTEAWVRVPTTVGVPPLPPEPDPNPPLPPIPPGPHPALDVVLSGYIAGLIPLRMSGTATPGGLTHSLPDINWILALIRQILQLLTTLSVTVDWQALLRDVSKLLTDLRNSEPMNVILQDVIAILKDLGLMTPWH